MDVLMTAAFSHLNDMKFGIDQRTVCVMTVGLGYVGLPLALTIHESGFKVVGFDIDSDRADRISRGERVISYMPENRIANAVATGRFAATSNASRLALADIILICVPTPLKDDRTPELRHVINASEEVAASADCKKWRRDESEGKTDMATSLTANQCRF